MIITNTNSIHRFTFHLILLLALIQTISIYLYVELIFHQKTH